MLRRKEVCDPTIEFIRRVGYYDITFLLRFVTVHIPCKQCSVHA